ncbi:CHASE2 domain-containing protein [Coleofasciculus sp. FACHB-129]|uniref:CHASE2 domain-containing protein n=1 Tax=Cyanophyceae TaxID=3028117 RepID=UPI001686D5F0|nr:CHASE2 domain-containing protein [Coleofasciculus sp. FACHB-129]MBD1897131.1 CHASE2 domain-containing protein [Coleofasciculus sp. FACHB-129]
MVSQLSSKIRSLLSNTNNLRTAALNFGGQVVLTSVVATSLVVGARQLGILQGQELGAFDQLTRMRRDEGPDNRLLLVEITEGDIQTEKGWPISDATIAKALEKLEQYEPRAIGIDIIRDVPVKEGNANLLKILKGSDRIITICQLSDGKQAGFPPPPGISPDQVGFADFVKEPDGWVRRSLLVANPPVPNAPLENPHLCSDPEEQLTSLDLTLALMYLQAEGIEAEPSDDGNLKIGSTLFKSPDPNAGGYRKADTEGLQMLINYRSANLPAQKITLTDVLKGKIDPALVKDRVVLVGYTAVSVNDDFNTPYSAAQEGTQKMPGVVIHAQVVSQILSAVLDKRPLFWYWSEWGEIGWIWAWSLVGGLVAWRIRRPLLLVIAGGGAIALLFGTCYVLFLKAGWIPLVPPALALVTTAVGVVLIDRGYAKAIYQGVKGFLKIDIEIDQEKKERQVAEITESDYFQELQEKAKNLRSRESNSSEKTTSKLKVERAEAAETTAETDYLQQLQQKGKSFRNRSNDGEAEATTESTVEIPEAAETTTEIDYLQQLQQKGQELRNRSNDGEAEATTEPTVEIPEATQASQATETTEEINYLQQLQKKGKKLRNRHHDGQAEAVAESNVEIPEVALASQITSPVEELSNQQDGQGEAAIDSNTSTPKVLQPSQEVEETEELDYFQQLQQRATLRNWEEDRQTQAATELNTSIADVTPASQETESEELDYFQQLQQRANLRNSSSDGHAETTTESNSSTIEVLETSQEAESEELDYFQQLQQRAKTVRNTETEST